MRKFSIEPPEFHALWDFQNPALSERRFWDYLSEGTQSWSEESHVLTQIGRAQTMQRRFAAAHETLDMARNVIETERDPAFTRYLLERDGPSLPPA